MKFNNKFVAEIVEVFYLYAAIKKINITLTSKT